MKKRNVFCIAAGCACLSFAVCDFFSWGTEVVNEKKILHVIAEQSDGSSLEKNVSLKEMNPEYVCMLEMEEPSLHLPIVQGNNDAYYLNHAFDSSFSSLGTPFFSSQTRKEDAVRIIYGHHVYYDATAMFSPLLKLDDAVDARFTLQYETYRENYAVTHVLHLSKDNRTFALRKQSFLNQEDFDQWKRYADEHTVLSYTVPCTKEDTYVILQTCGETDDTFQIVIGKRTTMESKALVSQVEKK